MLRPIVRYALNCEGRGQKTFSVLFWCRAGRHRSVVMVLLARAVFEHIGLEVTEYLVNVMLQSRLSLRFGQTISNGAGSSLSFGQTVLLRSKKGPAPNPHLAKEVRLELQKNPHKKEKPQVSHNFWLENRCYS